MYEVNSSFAPGFACLIAIHSGPGARGLLAPTPTITAGGDIGLSLGRSGAGFQRPVVHLPSANSYRFFRSSAHAIGITQGSGNGEGGSLRFKNWRNGVTKYSTGTT